MKANGRKTISLSLYDRHVDVLKRLAGQAKLSESEMIRELLELASNCKPVWNGVFLKFQKPRFEWGEKEESRYL